MLTRQRITKNKFALILMAGSALAISACDTTGTGDVDTAPPYATGRTASHGSEMVVQPVTTSPAPARTERVFRTMQSK